MMSDKLPAGWLVMKLGLLFREKTGSVDPSRYPEEEFDLHSIPAYESKKPEIISGSNIGSSKKALQPGDVLLSRIVPHIQRCWIVDANQGRRQIGSGEWIVFDGKKLCAPYLRYFLLSYAFHQKFMKTISGVGGSLTRANPNQVAEFDFPLAPLAEQNRIVAKIEELFLELDKGIESLKTAQQQLKVYRQAVLKYAFEGGLTNPNVKDGELPEGWVEMLLGDLISKIEAGKSFKCEERTPFENETGILKVSAITWGIYNEEQSKTVLDNSKVNPRYFVKSNDFLMSRANTLEHVGSVAIAEKVTKTMMLSDKTLKIEFNSSLEKYYALHYLRSSKGRRQIQALSNGNQESMRNIGQSAIKSIKISLPLDLKVQNKICHEIESRLSKCDYLDENIQRGLEQAEALKQSILKKAFEGKLVPQDPSDEPASVLLQRIKAEKAGQTITKKPRNKKATAENEH